VSPSLRCRLHACRWGPSPRRRQRLRSGARRSRARVGAARV